jgi:2-keto-4-pentenoate hydratase/2-oxohepta-3-ene-1,7-dioic acid hydratase in catechol pathway
MAAVSSWATLRDWAATRPSGEGDPIEPPELGPPVPRPTTVYGAGVHHREHVREAGMEPPATPMIFTKFPSCLVGPRADVQLSSDYVDWEVELVVVIGARARRVPEARALDYVAGYCVGQDVSDRKLQFSDKPPQFSLGKSLDTFGPTGPALVTLDELADPLDQGIECEISGERMQHARTSDMIFSVPALFAKQSARCTLESGDLVFTGTPSGVGSVRDPRRYLAAGDVIRSAIEGLGTMEKRCITRE